MQKLRITNKFIKLDYLRFKKIKLISLKKFILKIGINN
jgi:hypothetical protein